VWLRLKPGKNEVILLLDQCINSDLECLKIFERWSRHPDLHKYLKILESWDDKVCDDWGGPTDELHLNCMKWLDEDYYKVR